ncbi:hypothetical protein [Streptomyces sp. AK02-01A]|uniref:hypothetical protein n=1 Tax=Streptomyces sp. AK02-01A TaxID=3028648 RepID=UPI0029B555DF|nr:hypothetical protein [Streptomyces sp. AK02-01A]MDX3855921.1 hypothetical protein [Streptomyces sp. AK02-01A]
MLPDPARRVVFIPLSAPLETIPLSAAPQTGVARIRGIRLVIVLIILVVLTVAGSAGLLSAMGTLVGALIASAGGITVHYVSIRR